MKCLIAIREFFWPILGHLEPESIKTITQEDCKFPIEEIDLQLKYLDEYKKSEDARTQSVESKATIFIGTFAVAITVLITMVKDFILNSQISSLILNSLVIILVAITIVYLCRAVLFSIETLKRRTYHKFGFPQFMLLNEGDKKLQIFITQYNNVKKNQSTINLKVDYMTMAQLFFKRAVITVLMLTLIFVASYFAIAQDLIKNIRAMIQTITINEFVILIFAVVIIILSIIVLALSSRINKIKKRLNAIESQKPSAFSTSTNP